MKGKIDNQKTNIRKKKTTLPNKYNILDIIVTGREIIVDIRKMMELNNMNNKAEIDAAMNKATSNYHYFSRVENDLEEILDDEESEFKIWMAIKKSEYEDKEYSSESAKERAVLVDYEKEYRKKKNELRQIASYKKQCSIAKKSLEKYIDIIRSINSSFKKNISDPFPTSESD